MNQAIAITLGDPAGIGPEIIAKAFRQAPELTRGCFVVGDVQTIRRAVRQVCGADLLLPVAQIETPSEAFGLPPRCLPVLQVGSLSGLVPMGQISAEAGRLAGKCVVWAAQADLRGDV